MFLRRPRPDTQVSTERGCKATGALDWAEWWLEGRRVRPIAIRMRRQLCTCLRLVLNSVPLFLHDGPQTGAFTTSLITPIFIRSPFDCGAECKLAWCQKQEVYYVIYMAAAAHKNALAHLPQHGNFRACATSINCAASVTVAGTCLLFRGCRTYTKAMIVGV
jgi:hypothetical protein